MLSLILVNSNSSTVAVAARKEIRSLVDLCTEVSISGQPRVPGAARNRGRDAFFERKTLFQTRHVARGARGYVLAAESLLL